GGSPNAAAATINSTGLATAVAAGTTTISATLGAVSGSTGLTVAAGPLTITTTALPAAAVNQAYSATLAASGGTPPHTPAPARGPPPPRPARTPRARALPGAPTAAGTATFTVRVTAGAQNVTKALSITVTAGTFMIWPSNPVPAIVDGGDPGAVELGVKFQADVAGTITGIRFYKSAANTGTHVGNLWSIGGGNLGTGAFPGGTAAGRPQVTLAAPGGDPGNTGLGGLLLPAQRALRRERGLLHDAGRGPPAAARLGERGVGRQRRLRVRRGEQLPDQHVPGAELLGGRPVHPGAVVHHHVEHDHLVHYVVHLVHHDVDDDLDHVVHHVEHDHLVHHDVDDELHYLIHDDIDYDD